MSMIAAPYPLWIIWDETDGETRTPYYARVLGWITVTTFREGTSGPYPVVIHPETQLPATLGHDGPAPVSRMWVTELVDAAALAVTTRQAEHGGAR